jgi:hypothetical protein
VGRWSGNNLTRGLFLSPWGGHYQMSALNAVWYIHMCLATVLAMMCISLHWLLPAL